ncbi:hypothetical protein SI65_04555 [Aspergillus cristatus]|uniref:Altered inheritance of mitochondria protein 6 n=1 Tax=Aspergillus cristatus TaxID=573508 RepID=A0A1E3BF21_ASPCR|nr:hypothetical protein SI65_04555 [Aspergillus cristatus]
MADSPVGDEPKKSDLRWSGRQSTPWMRIRGIFTPFSSRAKRSGSDTDDALPLLSSSESSEQLIERPRRRVGKSRILRCLLYLLVGIFVMLGIVQFISILFGLAYSFLPDEFDRAATNWLNPDLNPNTDAPGSHYPTDISRDITPVGCHSHNDYWRRVPLFSALQAGCIGVEADVWYIDQNDHQDLYVGHTTSSLTPERTLRSMYVDPLVKILDRQNPITGFHESVDQPRNGVFDTDPGQTLILLVDFKTDGVLTWPRVVDGLEPLRERGYLTYFNGEEVVNGPVTVVGTGNAPFDLVTANSTYRDIFFDAPLDFLAEDSPHKDRKAKRQAVQDGSNLGQGLSGTPADITPGAFNYTNSFYASTSFKDTIGFPRPFHLTAQQMDSIRARIQGAHRRGLRVRYWGLPSWPRGLRNHIWRVLVHEGADILNVDDLQSATKKEWTPKVGDWW